MADSNTMHKNPRIYTSRHMISTFIVDHLDELLSSNQRWKNTRIMCWIVISRFFSARVGAFYLVIH